MHISIISHTSKPSESVGRLVAALGQQTKSLNYGNGKSKLEQYQYFLDNNILHPEWTKDYDTANKWLKEGTTVLARARIKGQTGVGITVVKPGETLSPDAKVFTKYVKKKREFRVNLFAHKFVNLREKLRQKPGTDNYIRNTANGYTTTYAKSVPAALLQRIKDVAENASKVSDSDFIGVDIAYNEFYDKLYVLEVNSGPSIEGSSVNEFINAIKASA